MEKIRPDFDSEIRDIAQYVLHYPVKSQEALTTAQWDVIDSLACCFMALHNPHCKKLLGPIVPNATLKNGARVPGTAWTLDPVQAAFNIGTLIRWLDFNDTWLAAEWGHPSDNLGGILAVADYLSRQRRMQGKTPLTMNDVFLSLIKAHEIQGIMALENSFNRVGLDHVVLVKVATTAVVTQLLGGDQEKMSNALSLAWLDGQSLRTYRHAPNTGSRKSWAAGDATSRGVRLSLMAIAGEMGYPSALTAPQWGFYDVSFAGQRFRFQRPYATYVMENILFKISFPAEFHAQTAVECAIALHPSVKHRWQNIKKIKIKTTESSLRIIDKKGPLYNPADRDHCLQYMIAIGLIFGELTAAHYEADVAQDPRIDALLEKMEVVEEPRFTREYLDPDKRSIGNAIQIEFTDGSRTDEISIDYPIGHRRRRREGIPLLLEKFHRSVRQHFDTNQAEKIIQTCENPQTFQAMSVDEWMDLLVLEK